MSDQDPNPTVERLDRATAGRLAKLRGVPVDLSRLRAAVEAEVPRPGVARARPARAPLAELRWLTPLRAAAAGLLLAGIVAAIVIGSSAGPALASPQRLAEIHEQVVSGKDHVTRVESFEAAQSALAAQWPRGPGVPEPGAAGHEVMACCVHAIGSKKMACVAFKADGVPVTMAVADAADVEIPPMETRAVGGVTYHVQSSSGVNMAMARRGGRWVCLMGKLPPERLIDLAGSLRF